MKQHHNPYAQMNHFAMHGPPKKSADKRYDLVWNGQTLVSNQPYGVCAGRKKQLIEAKTHNPKLFSIPQHK